ncbi:MAG TPA: citrate synthase family protein [Gemmatimonadaceae bacterium]|nr:citrate synthase family protein [Gemmatimonadaceae bacterium]
MSTAWISAAEAARNLDVTRATLYAYVSRGFIRSEAGPGASRARRYSRDDVERLRRRAAERRDPDKVAAHALQWGMPVLESSITLIADDTLYYRGHDVVSLAHDASVEAVASLIWTGRLDDRRPEFAPPAPSVPAPRSTPFIVRAQAALALASAVDHQAFDLRSDAVVRAGWRILDLLVGIEAPRARGPIDVALARGWRLRPGADAVVRAAIILCADHELNVSAFTARCVASAGSNPYAVVTAGLAALEGTKHGGSTARVEATLAAMRRERSLRAALAERLRHGQRIDGFGHPLYRQGDPRAAALLDMLERRYPKSPELRYARDFARAATALTGERPNVDFALGAVSRVLGLPSGSGLTLFAIGRTIGWIGHAIEQYAVDHIIRPRAKYVGVVAAAQEREHRQSTRTT